MHSTENTKTTNTKIIFPNSAKIMGFQLQCCFLRTQTHTHEIHSSSPNFTIVHQPVRKNLPGFIDINCLYSQIISILRIYASLMFDFIS